MRNCFLVGKERPYNGDMSFLNNIGQDELVPMGSKNSVKY